MTREPDTALDPEVFSRAAEMVWDRDNEFACLALDDAFYEATSNGGEVADYRAYHDEFAKWFCPPQLTQKGLVPWWEEDKHWPKETTNTEARCMALLLMHHLIIDGQAT